MSEGDPDARARFRALYDRTNRQVLTYCLRRTRHHTDAVDATADTYVVAWRRFDRVPDGDAALLWLFATARRVLANQRRTTRRREKLHERLRNVGSDVDGPEEIAVANEEQRTVLQALGRLSDDDRELLRLAVSEQLPHADIAALMGCTRNAVDIRLHRARKRLAKEFHRVHPTVTEADEHARGTS